MRASSSGGSSRSAAAARSSPTRSSARWPVRAKSLAKGPLHMVRGTGEAEKMLKNAKTEYFNEHEEIATYTAIETLAESVGDKETAKLAREIRRDEERMAKFLAGQIPVLTKAVGQRGGARGRAAHGSGAPQALGAARARPRRARASSELRALASSSAGSRARSSRSTERAARSRAARAGGR